jgi:hypothetical protein
MSRTRTLGLLLAPLLAACQSPSAPADPSGGATSPAATLSILDTAGATGPFALDDLERLTIGIQGKDLGAGSHAARLDVVDPSGTLYAQLPAALAAAADGNGAGTALLQVRGTTIEGYRQVGTWQVAAWIDGAPLASAAVVISE